MVLGLLSLAERKKYGATRSAVPARRGVGIPGGVAVRQLAVRAAPGPALVELADQPGAANLEVRHDGRPFV